MKIARFLAALAIGLPLSAHASNEVSVSAAHLENLDAEVAIGQGVSDGIPLKVGAKCIAGKSGKLNQESPPRFSVEAQWTVTAEGSKLLTIVKRASVPVARNMLGSATLSPGLKALLKKSPTEFEKKCSSGFIQTIVYGGAYEEQRTFRLVDGVDPKDLNAKLAGTLFSVETDAAHEYAIPEKGLKRLEKLEAILPTLSDSLRIVSSKSSIVARFNPTVRLVLESAQTQRFEELTPLYINAYLGAEQKPEQRVIGIEIGLYDEPNPEQRSLSRPENESQKSFEPQSLKPKQQNGSSTDLGASPGSCSSQDLRKAKLGTKCLTSVKHEFELIRREKVRRDEAREVWRDSSTGILWSDYAESFYDRDEAAKVCSAPESAVARGNLKDKVFVLPTAEEYREVADHGGAEVLPLLERQVFTRAGMLYEPSYAWTDSLREQPSDGQPSQYGLGFYFDSSKTKQYDASLNIPNGSVPTTLRSKLLVRCVSRPDK